MCPVPVPVPVLLPLQALEDPDLPEEAKAQVRAMLKDLDSQEDQLQEVAAPPRRPNPRGPIVPARGATFCAYRGVPLVGGLLMQRGVDQRMSRCCTADTVVGGHLMGPCTADTGAYGSVGRWRKLRELRRCRHRTSCCKVPLAWPWPPSGCPCEPPWVQASWGPCMSGAKLPWKTPTSQRRARTRWLLHPSRAPAIDDEA